MKKICIVLLCFLAAVFLNNQGVAKQASINGENMKEFVMLGKMKAKQGCEEKLEDALKTLSEATYTEPGCLLYALHRDVEDPSIFVLVEGWVSKEALEAHFNSPHFLQQVSIITSLIVGEPELTYLTPLCTGKKGSVLPSSQSHSNALQGS
jgi:quinol monooxygenase YgiN